MADPEPDVETLIERLHETDQIKEAIRRHLLRQLGVAAGLIRWSDGTLHRLGEETDDDEG